MHETGEHNKWRERKNHKKPTPPYWTIFSILSFKELESSHNHKAILWCTMEKTIWRLGATLLKIMSFLKPKIPNNAWEKKLLWEILLLVFNHERLLVAHIINRFWKNTAKTPIRKQFHSYIWRGLTYVATSKCNLHFAKLKSIFFPN